MTTQCAAQHATCTTQPLCNKCKERDRETGIKWAVVENTNHVADLLVRVAYCCWPWESKSENHPYSPSNRFQNTFTAMETEVQRPVKAMCKAVSSLLDARILADSLGKNKWWRRSKLRISKKKHKGYCSNSEIFEVS